MSNKHKYRGMNKKKQKERQKKTEERQKDGVLSIVRAIQGNVDKFGNEWAEKHNALAQRVEAIFQNAATDIGRLVGNQEIIVSSNEMIDRNVLALSEMVRDVYFRLEFLDRMIKTLAEKAGVADDLPVLDEVRQSANKVYGEMMAEAFKIAIEKIQKNRERQEAEAKVAEEARLAAEKKEAELKKKAEEEAKSTAEEADRATKALRETEMEDLDKTKLQTTSGGAGANIPAGAQVFGGG